MQHSDYITKHRHYIDNRIAVLSGFINESACGRIADDGASDTLVDSLITAIMGESTFPQTCGREAADAVSELRQLASRWDIAADGDIIGYIYQGIKTRNAKKKQGQFFTPADVVTYLIDRVISPDCDIESLRLLDPACGSGQFLMAAVKRLTAIYCMKGIGINEAVRLILSRNVYGIDNDPMAIRIARHNLCALTGGETGAAANLFTADYLNDTAIRAADDGNKFDIILGNPPWGSRFSPEKKRVLKNRFQCAASGVNSFTMFIERSLQMLTSRGTLAFLIPEAYLNIKAHTASRQQVLQNTRIIDIAPWGEKFKGVFAPAVSLIVQREPDQLERSRHIVQIQHPGKGRAATATLIPQEHYSHTPHSIFNIHYSRRAVSLITKIGDQDCFYLKDRAQFYLGVVTGNNPKFIHTRQTEDFPDPILIGRDIDQYSIRFSGHYFKYNPAALQQVASGEYYRAKNKLLYKFIGKKLIFALDRSGYFSLNNVNGIIPAEVPLEPECLVAVLNSHVMQYFYEKNFFTVKVLRGNLEKLPIKNMRLDSRSLLLRHSRALIDADDPHAAQTHRDAIEDIIFYEYGIRDGEAAMIHETAYKPGQAIFQENIIGAGIQ